MPRDKNGQVAVHCICDNDLAMLIPDDVTLGLAVTCDECDREWHIVLEQNGGWGKQRQRYALEWVPQSNKKNSLISMQIILPYQLQKRVR